MRKPEAKAKIRVNKGNLVRLLALCLAAYGARDCGFLAAQTLTKDVLADPTLVATSIDASAAAAFTGSTYIWDGGGSANRWTTARNWDNDTAPSNDGKASVIFDGSIRLNPQLDQNWNISSLSFAKGADAFVLGTSTGSALTIQSGGITDDSANVETIQHSLVLGTGQTWTVNGTRLAVSGSINTSGQKLFIDGTGETVLNGVISGSGSLTKDGTGTLFLQGANTFTGPVTINEGVVRANSSTAFGTTAGGVVGAGGTIALEGGITVGSENLSISGSGYGGLGALRNLSGNNRWQGNLTLTADSTIASDSGTLSLGVGGSTLRTVDIGSKVLTFDGSGDIEMNARIVGSSGSVVKRGTGTVNWYFADNNTFTGNTTVESGKLILDMLDNGNGAVLGTLTVGDGIGGAGADIVELGLLPYANEEIRNVSGIVINESGRFRLNGQLETINQLTMTGGSIDMDPFRVTPGYTGSVQTGTLTVQGGITSTPSSMTATVSGNLSLGGGTRTFSIADGAAAIDMNLDAVVSNGSVQKTGAGTLALSGSSANTYTGNTTIDGGTLLLQKNPGVYAVAGGNIIVNTGGTLLLGAQHQIQDTVGLTLNRATFGTGGYSEALNTLTLTADSVIDLGSGNSILEFNAAGSWNSGATLTIVNWSGDINGGGADQLKFGAIAGSQITQIIFQNPFGLPAGLYAAKLIGTEIVPVPEASTYVALILLGSAVAVREFRRRGLPLALDNPPKV